MRLVKEEVQIEKMEAEEQRAKERHEWERQRHEWERQRAYYDRQRREDDHDLFVMKMINLGEKEDNITHRTPEDVPPPPSPLSP